MAVFIKYVKKCNKLLIKSAIKIILAICCVVGCCCLYRTSTYVGTMYSCKGYYSQWSFLEVSKQANQAKSSKAKYKQPHALAFAIKPKQVEWVRTTSTTSSVFMSFASACGEEVEVYWVRVPLYFIFVCSTS